MCLIFFIPFWIFEPSTDGKSKQVRKPEEFSASFNPFQDFETRTSFHEDYSYGRNVPRDFNSDGCSQKSSFFRRQLHVDHFDVESAEVADYLFHFQRVARWNGWSHEEKGFSWQRICVGQRNRYWDVKLILKLMIMAFFALYSRTELVLKKGWLCTEVSSGTERSLTENLFLISVSL